MSAAGELTHGTGRVIVERESVNDDSVVVTRLIASDGADVQKGQPVLEVETSKTASEVVAPVDGRVSLRAGVGDELSIGELLFEISPTGTEPGVPEAPSGARADSDALTHAVDQGCSAPKLSTAARRAAQVHGIGLQHWTGGAWVTATEVVALAGNGTRAAGSTRQAPVSSPAASSQPAASRSAAPSVLEVLSKRKLNEIRSLSMGNSHGSTSTIGASLLVVGSRLVKPPPVFRETIADLIMYEAARLLGRYPRLNAFWADDRHIGLYQHVNFGVSFDSGDKLKVLAIRAAETLCLSEIQREFSRLLELYESGARIEDELLASATVTMSDLSAAPVSFMHPLVNGRQALILGVTRPTATRYDVFASFDHRVADGLGVARFLGELSERVCSHFHEHGVAGELRCSACWKPMEQELRLGGRGLLDITLGDGSKGLLCRTCFVGY